MAKAKTATKKTSKKEIIVKPQIDESIISSLILNGDVSKMSQDEKAKYNIQLCKSLGLNPLTQPFQILKLNGKEVLYATKSATEQLRKAQGVSVVSLDRKVENDICIVTAIVKDNSGRTDAATGAVNIKGMAGDALANAIMKSETKAKRRATLSICGLGFLDESEIETIPGAQIAVVTDSTKEEIDADAAKRKYDEFKYKMNHATDINTLALVSHEYAKNAYTKEQLEDLRLTYKARRIELEENK